MTMLLDLSWLHCKFQIRRNLYVEKKFLVSDGNPLTRQQICESSLKSKRYDGMDIPIFTGTKDDPIGKLYDGSYTNKVLKWKPKNSSFDEFMASS
mmetsp:Transcript_58809/g.143859  ORF Transcript_58809/g.143859 Transcript_58809/m.143859 type:complete len:95 (-) Transcript_58809:813-1097(-)